VAKVRVYELAKEFGVESKTVMVKLQEMGEFVRSASSTIEAPVVRRLKEAFATKATDQGQTVRPKPSIDGPRPTPAPRPGPGGGQARPQREPSAPITGAPGSGAPAVSAAPSNVKLRLL